MMISKQKKSKKIKKKKATKRRIRRHRRKAAKIKAKAEKHRQRHRQKRTDKGFFAIIGSYINKALQIEQDFQGKPFAKKANSKYSSANIIKAFVCLVILGIKRVYHAKDYQDEHLLAKVIGLPKFPSATTIYRFLKKFGTLTFCRRVRRVNRDQISKHLAKQKEIVCDGDTSTIQTYSQKKDGSCKGFNKKRPGSFCLQALMYFVNGMSIFPDIMPGNKVPQKALKTLDDLKEVRRICGHVDWIRLDSGFMGQRMLEELDNFSRQAIR